MSHLATSTSLPLFQIIVIVYFDPFFVRCTYGCVDVIYLFKFNMRPHYANIWGNPSNSEHNAAQIRRNVWHFDMILALPTINSTQIIPKHWILDKFFSSCFSLAKISTERKINESTVIQDFWRGCSAKIWNYILQQPWWQFVFERLLYKLMQSHSLIVSEMGDFVG